MSSNWRGSLGVCLGYFCVTKPIAHASRSTPISSRPTLPGQVVNRFHGTKLIPLRLQQDRNGLSFIHQRAGKYEFTFYLMASPDSLMISKARWNIRSGNERNPVSIWCIHCLLLETKFEDLALSYSDNQRTLLLSGTGLGLIFGVVLAMMVWQKYSFYSILNTPARQMTYKELLASDDQWGGHIKLTDFVFGQGYAAEKKAGH